MTAEVPDRRRRWKRVALLASAAILAAGLVLPAWRPWWSGERTPFEAVRWEGRRPVVLVQGAWLAVDAVDGVPIDEFLGHVARAHGRRWKHRFASDFLRVRAEQGVRNPLWTRLTAGGTTRRLPMTWANRRRVLAHEQQGQRVPPSRACEASPEAAAAIDDVAALAWMLQEHWAYLPLVPEHRSLMDELHCSVARGVSREDFARAVGRTLARLGDGHSGLLPNGPRPPRLPFELDWIEGRLVVSGWGSRAPRVVASLCGRTPEEWREILRPLVTQAGPAFEDAAIARVLRSPQRAHEAIGEEAPAACEVVLTDGTGGAEERVGVDLNEEAERARPDRAPSLTWTGDAAVLRLPSMEDGDDIGDSLEAFMSDVHARGRGLVIDLRGNGGGRRDAVWILLPWLVGEPTVINAARVRIDADDDPLTGDYGLDSRGLVPASAVEPADRPFVDAFFASFRPEIEVGDASYSPWHVAVVRPREDGRRLGIPVVVLIDGGVFSAADILAGALKGRERTVLMGSRTGGGSGAARTFILPNSALFLRLSTMISFQPDGTLYNVHGVRPDAEIEPTLADVLAGRDTVMEAALRRLAESP